MLLEMFDMFLREAFDSWRDAKLFLAPSLVLFVPLLLLLLFFDKAGNRYRICWRGFVAGLAIVIACTFIYFMWIPYPSQVYRNRMSGLEGMGSPFLGLIVLFFMTSTIIPSFPALFLLGLFPPKSYSQAKQLKIRKIMPIGVAILASCILIKYRAYMADRNPPFDPVQHKEAELVKQWKQEQKMEAQKEREEKEEKERIAERERIEAMSETERAEWEMLQRKWAESTKKRREERAERDAKRREEIERKRIEKWEAGFND